MMNDPAPRKALGQHWLDDPVSLQAMADAADVAPTDTVLEIGPGLGTLTQVLVSRAKTVVAVELDHELASQLQTRVPAVNLQVTEQNILQFDLTQLPPGYKVVANIPYYLTSNLIRILSESINPPSRAVLLVQQEVAERVAAAPGEMSLLSVTSQWFWSVSLDMVVPAALFTPPPKVDSQILVLTRRAAPLFPDVDTKVFFRMVKAGFSQRRKTLLNSLSAGLHLDKQAVKDMLAASGVAENTRAQSLSLEQWHALYKSLIS